MSTNLALAEGEVYSQPAATGVGVHESTQLVAAIDALKVGVALMQRHGNPVRLEDFALMHGLNGLLDGKSGLFQRFSQHPKVHLRVPDVVDLAADLESEGLSATKEIDNAPKVQPQQAQRGRKGKPKRGAAPRKFKLQNTHLQGVDLSKDFVKQ
ncbi:hypothetical protein MOBT1_000288 [Malassezia obtusa]|uniref:Transcription initiation factor IIE subunit beta n=1 Tax=Malassezia obtusa TaxID=76774 RepID=A0AAF0DY57_9BASI|nr:hypothetical protein MOBT1_000288 [Malassezia obtusa]